MTEQGRGLIAINLAVLLFGTAGLFGKLLTFSPVLIVSGRVAFASLALLIFLLLRKEDLKLSKNISHNILMIILGIILAVHWLTFFQAIQISTVAIGLLSFSTFPIFVALLEPLLFKEKLSVRYIFLALITFGGIRLFIPSLTITDNVVQGVLWGTLSGLLFAFLTIINRKMVNHYRAVRVAFYQNFIAFLCLLPFVSRYITQVRIFYHVIMLIILGVIFTALSHTLFIYGLKSIKARTASIIACLEPVYGIILALVILNEIPDKRTLAGGLIIIGAVFYTTVYTKHKEKK